MSRVECLAQQAADDRSFAYPLVSKQDYLNLIHAIISIVSFGQLKHNLELIQVMQCFPKQKQIFTSPLGQTDKIEIQGNLIELDYPHPFLQQDCQYVYQIIGRRLLYDISGTLLMRKLPEVSSSLQSLPAPLLPRKEQEEDLIAEIDSLRQENMLLAGINSRLGDRLAWALAELGLDKEGLGEGQSEQPAVYRHEQLQMLRYLDPLLLAYDSKIDALESVIEQLNRQSEQAVRKADLLEEDSKLFRQQLQNKNEYIISLCKGIHPDSGLAEMYSNLRLKETEQYNENVLKENDYLVKHVRRLQSSLQQSKAVQEEASKGYSELTEKIKALIGQSRDYQLRLQETDKIRGFLELKLREATDQAIKHESNGNALQSKLAKLANQCKIAKAQAQTLKVSLVELQQKYELRTKQLESEIEDVKREEKSLFMRNTELQNQNQSLNKNVSDLRQQNNQLKAENQNMLTMLQNYQSKVTHTKRSLDLAETALQAAKERQQNAVLENDRLELLVEQKEDKMQLLTDGFRQEIHELKASYESLLQAKSNSREHDIDQQVGVRDKEREKAKRQKDREREKVQRERERERLRMEEKKRQQDRQKGTENIQGLMREQQDFNQSIYKQKIESLQEQLQNCLQTIRKQQSSRKELQFSNKTKISEIDHLQDELRRQKSKSSGLQKEVEELSSQLGMFKREANSKTTTEQAQYLSIIQSLEQRLADSVRKEKLIKEQMIRKLRSYDQEQEDIRKQYQERIRHLQLENAHLKRRK